MDKTVQWAIQKAFLHAQRKDSLPVGNKYQALLAIADSMQKLWASEPGVEWDSLYSLETIGKVSATDSFSLPDEVNYISKNELDPITLTDGTNTVEYKLVRPNQLRRYRDTKVCAQIGRTLKFATPFTSSSNELGYSIKVPTILYTEDLARGTDTIQVDDPMWLVYMMAAEYVRNDTVKQAQRDNLLGLAMQTMERMKDANSGQFEEVTREWAPAGADWV